VDLKEKWLKPLIYCFRQNDVNEDIISSGLFTNRSIEMFNRGEFTFPEPETFGPFCETNRYFCIENAWHCPRVFEKISYHCDVLLKSVDVSSVSIASLSYKPLLYHIEAYESAIISRALQRPLHNTDNLVAYVPSEDIDNEWRQDPVSNVIWEPENEYHPILPLQCTVAGEEINIEKDDGGVFEVKLLGNKIAPPRKFVESEKENSGETVNSSQQFNSIEDDKIREFVQQCSLSGLGYDEEMKDLQYKSEQFSKEMDFMANYFAQTWGFPVSENQKLEAILQNIMEQTMKAGLGNDAPEVKKKKRKIDDDNVIPNPLVYFQVEGEVVPILRSTIMRVIPDSQLAIRVSGRWQDQPSDVDEDGNLIVRCPKDAFKHILASLQVHNPTREEDYPLEIFVNEYSKHAIEETLDFLQITPHFIRFLDCEF
jgi:hypothetical protein